MAEVTLVKHECPHCHATAVQASEGGIRQHTCSYCGKPYTVRFPQTETLAVPDSPDFKRIADEIIDDLPDRSLAVDIAAALRQAWNARGTADVEAVRRVHGGGHGHDVVAEIKQQDR